jgi:serine/threonine protein kinase
MVAAWPDWLKQGPIPLAEALDIAIQVCWAMEFAHGKHKVHRDLKPANVLLTTGGLALVTDFGLVKFLEAEALSWAPGQLSQEETVLLGPLSLPGARRNTCRPSNGPDRRSRKPIFMLLASCSQSGIRPLLPNRKSERAWVRARQSDVDSNGARRPGRGNGAVQGNGSALPHRLASSGSVRNRS